MERRENSHPAGHLSLLATMMRLALKEEHNYIFTPCGRWWLSTMGLSQAAMWRGMGGRGPLPPNVACRQGANCKHDVKLR